MIVTNKTLIEERMDRFIGNLLRTGVIIAGIIVLIGGVFYLIRHGGEIPNYQTFRSEPDDLRTLGGILNSVIALKASAIIQIGIILLIATPIARVAFSVYAFIIQKDRVYVGITILVLALLIFSLTGGHL
jgi:uncharacterized membrane protein